MNGLSHFSDTGSFLESLSNEGDRTAIVFGTRDYSYKTVARLSAETIASAKNAGLPHCGRIATILPDHPITAIAILGLTSVANILPLNPTLAVHELQTIAREAGVCGVLYDGGSAVSAELGERLELGKFALDLATGAIRSMEALASIADSGNASTGLTLLTSGSTGDPKRVPLSGTMLLASAANIARTLSLGPRDRAAHILPMFHIGALVDLLLAPLVARGSVAIGEDRTPQSMRSLVLTQRANWLQLVPTMLIRCLEEFGDREYQEMGERLRFIRSVSADLAPELQATAERRFGVPVIQMYGMTEAAGQITSNPLPPSKRKPGTVGLPAGPDVAILDEPDRPRWPEASEKFASGDPQGCPPMKARRGKATSSVPGCAQAILAISTKMAASSLRDV
jgi:acyl-CoA synthetase (AMP-forming)/AMP-acid ligase II